ncbi:MAG: CBS domain-containing protein [Candidatus Marinimicrobia bacterium]|nr:CBS domain-containing protein [Candidatus Neomarinimicrobiota bacterium]
MTKTLTAKDIMTKDVITIGPDIFLDKAIKKLIENKISGMPVVDENEKMIGIISEKDILNFAFCGYLRSTKVKEAMSTDVIHFGPETRIEKIAVAISKNHFRRVPIIKEGKVVGIVSRRDIIRNVFNII